MQSQPMPDPDKFAIGAIFKNERPYILEWIAFHRTIGIEKFLIGDNDSTDGSKDLLRLLDLAGIIHYFDFPSEPGVKPQRPCYSKILKVAKNLGIEWVAFIDADEFLMPEAEEMDFFSCIEAAISQPDTGAVAINWAIYGSSGWENRPEGLVLKDFTKRAPLGFSPNLHYKSLVKLEAAIRVPPNPHHFHLENDFKYKNLQGSTLAIHPNFGIGLSNAITSCPLKVNHYVVKSRAEFFDKKSPKGSANSEAISKGKIYFEYHDRNDEADPCSPKRIHETIVEMEEISNQLSFIKSLEKKIRKNIIIENCNRLRGIAEHPYLNGENLPAGFDPLHYLLLNPDVLIAGADPVQHYLEFGKKENRKYQL